MPVAPSSELRRQLQWLMTFRVVITTTLLVCTFVIELLFRPLLPLLPFYALAVSAYLLTLVYAGALRSRRAPRMQAHLQLAGDAAIITGFVYLTGGAQSPFSFLYLPGIVAGCILLLRRGGFVVALTSWFLYASLVLLLQRGILPASPQALFEDPGVPPVRLVYTLLAHLVSFIALAYLASHLTESLRRTGAELERRSGEILELRALHDNIIDSINSGLLTTDASGRITFANRAAAEITGREALDLGGISIGSLLRQPDRFLEEIRAALDRRSRHRFEIDWKDERGRELFLGFTVSVLRERDGRPVGMIFIFQDLTEIRVLEEEVALKKRMAALGEMAAGVAHELRNPLASLSGSVQVLQRDLRPRGEAGELMEIVVKETKRLDGIIRDFLLFAKPGRFAPAPVNLVPIIEQSAKLLRNSRELRADHVIRIHAASPEIWSEVDANRMKQVFWNLAINALKAMPGGGTLTIALQERGDEIEVSFEDSGVGMSEEALERYFQPFRGEFVEGTGLGAAIVYRIVEEHGGSVGLRSRPGHGTRVRITLPAARPVALEPAGAA